MRLIAVLVSVGFAAPVAAQSYSVVDLPQEYYWEDMNDRGDVTGPTTNGFETWSARMVDGVVERLDLPGRTNQAKAINNLGFVVGTHSSNSFGGAFLYDTEPVIFDLQHASDINEHGAVSGVSYRNGIVSGGIWKDGVMTTVDPQTLDQLFFRAINNHGAVVGVEITFEFGRRDGVYWTEATGLVNLGANTSVRDINDLGYACGDGMIWLNGVLHSTFVGAAGWINNSNHMLGYTGAGATVWRGNGAELIQPLIQDSRYVVDELLDFNERGQILAGVYFNGSTDAQTVILTPVPEPGTWLAMGIGTTWLVRSRRRQR
ncbi:MAG TPA: PEP-CTERM sorting domain-containing protein [Fimbriimonadaceae bacterium]|nr:PEP-CTERM sorting domain-containing protein [Fimbriimonadaceae bacterium]